MQMLPTGSRCPYLSGTQVSKEDSHQAARESSALICKDLAAFPYILPGSQIPSIMKESHTPHTHNPLNLSSLLATSVTAGLTAGHHCVSPIFVKRPACAHLSLQLQEHAVVGLQAHAGTEHILQHCSLLAKGIDDWCTLGHDRCLFHIGCMSAAFRFLN